MSISSVSELAHQCGANWPYLRAGREKAEVEVERIAGACSPFLLPDTSLVVFGSLARGEFTDASDIDWTLLVDGITIPEHLAIARKVELALAALQAKEPGRTGTFGNLAASHNLIHFIGGDDDTNANTTRRSLLMLEARAIGPDETFSRVRNNLLKRYLEEDLGLWRETTKTKVPHFLLNDFARYWRTMTVDFADKQHDRFHEGFALRNIKLRLSRKLMYMAGLLACFRCQLDFPEEGSRVRFFRKENILAVIAFLGRHLDKTPLDIVVESLSLYAGKSEALISLVEAYDAFLGVLSEPEKRKHLEKLKPEELEFDSVYKEARDISHSFAQAIEAIFLTADNPIGQLTIRYGVF